MSYGSQSGTPIEEWQDLMNWDDDTCATVSNGLQGSQSHNYLAPVAPSSPYLTSAPPSNYGGPSSFDCNVSAAPSIVGQSSSYGQFYGTSPTFSSATTSPLMTRDELPYFGSFGACDNFFPSLGEAAEPPLLDTTRDRIVESTGSLPTTTNTFLNPHIAGSFQTFSNREIVASQILASAGTQFGTSSTDEAIAEGNEYDFSTSTAPIPIIRTSPQSFHDTYGYYEPSQDRTLTSCIGPAEFKISSDISYKIPLHFGFGLPLALEVNPVFIENEKPLVHEHLVYSWPPQSSTTATHTQPVLPAVLSASAASDLARSLDEHLEHLVVSEFKAFPPYCSPLRILDKVYTFFRSLPKHSDSARLLLQALKLLVLVHVGGDITLPKQSDSTSLKQLVRCTMNISEDMRPSPCLIRSQFGTVMPELASKLMREVLSVLEPVLFSRNENNWPVALATLTVILMTVESIQYHAAKLPYHDAYGPARPENSADSFEADDSAVETILTSYKACFSACHTRLQPDWKGDLGPVSGKSSPADEFVKSVREAVGKGDVESYLAGKLHEKRHVDDDDMDFFFDRLVARLLLLES
ncbi:hypothetical protein E8E13_010578 [Curvularia kusanoi]|uniref:Uncharacterized protein n=1 Tax=Curvularia kusanoi TaxID=90978 RepID=A0A9P4THS5_CURKU|nr:hypothetical protein E8E13_010578 [Curvularia kusanoi]